MYPSAVLGGLDMITYDTARFSLIGSRKDQQDSSNIISGYDMSLAVVCDGLGGHMGGAKASATAVDMLSADFERARPDDIPMFLVRSAQSINEAVYAISTEDGTRMGAGTTIVCTVLDGDRLFWLSIGDSRIYLMRDGELTQITQDHNFYLLLNERLESGQITEEEFEEQEYMGSSLISVLGMKEVGRVGLNTKPIRLHNEDIVILMSDGLYKALADEQIAECLKGSAQECADELQLRLSGLETDELDNTTVIIQRIVTDE